MDPEARIDEENYSNRLFSMIGNFDSSKDEKNDPNSAILSSSLLEMFMFGLLD